MQEMLFKIPVYYGIKLIIIFVNELMMIKGQ